MSSASMILIKLGGSLMDLPDLRERLLSFIGRLRQSLNAEIGDRLECPLRTAVDQGQIDPSADVLIIPGGGAAADEIRRLDQFASLTPEQSHRAAIEAMSLNAVVLVRTLGCPFVTVVSREQTAEALTCGRIPILSPTPFLMEEESVIEQVSSSNSVVLQRLPASWDITSDSISAWIAHRWPAAALILLKSTATPDQPVSTWSECGIVDPAFEQVSRGLRVKLVNLRVN